MMYFEQRKTMQVSGECLDSYAAGANAIPLRATDRAATGREVLHSGNPQVSKVP
jgi:hypothetical protein